MGTSKEEIEVDLIFLLALKGKNQIETLQKLMEIFSNEEILETFKNMNSNKKFYKKLKERLEIE